MLLHEHLENKLDKHAKLGVPCPRKLLFGSFCKNNVCRHFFGNMDPF